MTKEDNELLELLKNGDCPSELIDLLEETPSKWRRGVIKEFISDHLWKKAIEDKIRSLSRENKAIIALLTILVIVALKNAIFGV